MTDLDYRKRCAVQYTWEGHDTHPYEVIYYGLDASDVVGRYVPNRGLALKARNLDAPWAEDIGKGRRPGGAHEKSRHFFTQHLGKEPLPGYTDTGPIGTFDRSICEDRSVEAEIEEGRDSSGYQNEGVTT
jgi:hypothetical protein